ncbi:MAG: AAA family ATPase, partial [Chlamydiia bacterium]|nr:AAA family ATPase [Chlamydiia bacterium]
MALDTEKVSEEAKRFSPKFKELFDEIGKIIVGQKELVEQMVVALLADGHLLVEGLPGLAKTLAVNTLAKVTAADFKRIQFTPDLLPADLTGTTIYNQADGKFTVKKGPIFTNILLADEINRSPPKVQAALLEVMQERQVTIGGETYKTGDPFLVFATQNPIEQEGTYVLPEAQTDRFMMKLLIDYPAFNEERLILERMARLSNLPEVKPVISTQEILDARKVVDKVFIDEKILDYILKIVFATRTPESY